MTVQFIDTKQNVIANYGNVPVPRVGEKLIIENPSNLKFKENMPTVECKVLEVIIDYTKADTWYIMTDYTPSDL